MVLDNGGADDAEDVLDALDADGFLAVVDESVGAVGADADDDVVAGALHACFGHVADGADGIALQGACGEVVVERRGVAFDDDLAGHFVLDAEGAGLGVEAYAFALEVAADVAFGAEVFGDARGETLVVVEQPDLVADLQNMGDRFVSYQGENYVDPIDALYDKVASSPKL